MRNKFELSTIFAIFGYCGTVWHHKCYPSSVRFRIRRVFGTVLAVLAVIAVCSLCRAQSNSAVDRTAQQQPKEDPKGKSDPKGAASLTGCIDEQDGQWVLVNPQNMAILANLAADGFPAEAFAKHMGHKVTVRGTANSDGARPIFKVRSIETISETCAAR